MATEGDALLAVLETEHDESKLKVALDGISKLLEPLLALGSSSASVEALRPLARALGPLVTRMVKALNNRLGIERGLLPQQLRVLGYAAGLGLNALDCLRPVIKATQHELDVQRYGFVRKLAALGLHEEAMAQGKLLYDSVVSGPGSTTVPCELHIAAVVNMLVCYHELVQKDPSKARLLWTDVGRPLNSLLAAAREAADSDEAGRRLLPVLKCLSKVSEQLQHAEVVSSLGPEAVAQQLLCLEACSVVCRQQEAVMQMLIDDATGAPEAMCRGLLEALLWQLETKGSLSTALCSLLHHVGLAVIDERAERHAQFVGRLDTECALGAVVRIALQLPHCVLGEAQSNNLPSLLASLSAAAGLLAEGRETQHGEDGRWMRWRCLDVLRASAASVLTQLASAPQAAGGHLTALSQCMELLAEDSLGLLRYCNAQGTSVLPSACSAVTIAARLTALHRVHTGRLAGMQEDMARNVGIMQRLMQPAEGTAHAVSPAMLQSVSASLGNTGLDLLQGQHVAAAAELLQLAAQLAVRRARQLFEVGTVAAVAELLQLVKKCKAHVTALQQLPDHAGAMAAAATYVGSLHEFLGGNIQHVTSLAKLYVRSSVSACAVAEALRTAALTGPPPVPVPASAATAAPPAPCKAPRRGGRLQRMQAEPQSQAPGAAEARKQPEGVTSGGAATVVGQPAAAQQATLSPTAMASSLTQALVSAAQAGRASPALLDSLDVYAAQELDIALEECNRRYVETGFQQMHTASVLGTLDAYAGSPTCSTQQRARALLVKALVANTSLTERIRDLRVACELLDAQLPGIEQAKDRGGQGASASLGLLDSAALARAQLGVCLAQERLEGRIASEHTESFGHVRRALDLWRQLVGSTVGVTLRMPTATLHAVLSVHQLLHLHACGNSDTVAECSRVAGQLVRTLSNQVKLRDQHAYMLCVTLPANTCLRWMLAPQPWKPLAAATDVAPQHGKLSDVLSLTAPARDAYAPEPFGHLAVATAAACCASELERSGFLRHGPAPQLLRSQCHHIAAAAYLRAGDSASSYVHAQEALRITCSLFSLLETSSPSGQGSAAAADKATPSERELTPAEAAAAAVQGGAETSAQDYAPQDEDAEDEFSQLGRSQPAQPGPGASARADAGSEPTAAGASRSGADAGPQRSNRMDAGLAWAIVAAHLASLHQAARVFEAAGCVEDATCLWKECSRTAETFGVPSVRALCSCFLAELSCRRGDVTAARTYVEAAAAAVKQLEPAAAVAPDALAGDDRALLTAHICAARARVALHSGQHEQVVQAHEQGVAACDRVARETADRQLGASSSADGSLGDARAWYSVSVRSQLHRLHAEALLHLGCKSEAAALMRVAATQLQHAAAERGAGTPASAWPVDHGLLLALDSAVTVEPAATCRIACESGAVVGLGTPEHAAGGLSGSHRGDTDGELHADQANKKGTRAKPGRTRPKQEPKQQAGSHADSPPSTCSVLSKVPAMLQSLQLCWQVPLAAAYACKQLLRACTALGLPHAATMFLHLGQGMSYAQQQDLQRQQRLRSSAASRGQQEAECSRDSPHLRSGSTGEQEDAAPGQGLCGVATVRDAALRVLSDLGQSGSKGGESLAALEHGAERWLSNALHALPAGTVVAAIVLDDEADQVVLSRAVHGSVPLVVSLRRQSDSAAQASESSSSSSAGDALAGCLQRLRALQEESGDSMHMDQDAAATQSHKAKWWKTRMGLDQSVKVLLHDLEDKCLGPWRCLLLPAPARHRDALLAAADAFAQEHFPALDANSTMRHGEVHIGRTAVLREVLCLALSHMQHLQSPDVRRLLAALCSQVGNACDAAHLDALVAKLSAAEAAARIELLRIPSCPQGEPAAGAAASCQREESEGTASMSIEGAAANGRGASAANRAAACSHGEGATRGSRARPALACIAPQAGQGAAPAVRRAVGARPAVLRDETVVAGKPGPVAEVPERGKRASRLTALKPESSSSSSVQGPAASAARSSAARGTLRGRPAAAAAAPAPKATQPSTASQPDSRPASPSTSQGAEAVASVPCSAAAGAQQGVSCVLLALSPTLHALPWESIPCVQGVGVYRILNLSVACAAASALQLVTDNGQAAASSDDTAASSPSMPSAYYLLNPSGDLVDTQAFFQPLLEAQHGWQGLTGEKPGAKDLLAALQANELFLYFGHGSGEQFLPTPALRKLQRCASCVLMGCSSGRLRLHGTYDPSGAAVAYLLAGCPALVANLWDVTDRDIDRYCQALLNSWLGCAGVPQSAAAETAKGEATDADSKPNGRQHGCEPIGLAVSRSRAACKLPHLVGAAPVTYGLPLQLQQDGHLGWPI